MLHLLHALYDELAEEDPILPSDLLVVFGAKTLARIQKAVELYATGVAPKILLSGGRPAYAPAAPPEAERDRDIAIAAGIPPEALIVEPDSITIADNAKRSLNVLDSLGMHPARITLVNSPYVQRRGWAHVRKFAPPSLDVRRVNARTLPLYERASWFDSEAGVRVVLNEYVKLRVAVALETA
jgi:uncharacterized SAM-binding protein YcdF (DUF218 family)